MEKPVILQNKTVAELPRRKNNPRNSEGDFARLNNGDLLFAYSKYSGDDAHDDAACDIAGLISSDNGKTFRELPQPLATAAELNTKNIMSVSLARLDNETLCLIYLCKKGPYSEVWLKRANKDNETQFSSPELCIPKKRGIYYVVNNCRVCKLPDGRLLLPLAQHPIKRGGDGKPHGIYFGFCKIFSADADGRNWHECSGNIRLPYPGHSGTGLQEPGLTLLPDGTLYGYFRTDRHFQFESFSEDEGKTWTKPVPSRFTSPDSPMLILRNPYSGIYYSLWNPIPNYNGRIDPTKRWVNAGRTPFVLAQSENGIDFGEYAVIEDDPLHGYCYPAIHFLNEKEMLISYCCGGPEDGMCLTKTKIIKLKMK